MPTPGQENTGERNPVDALLSDGQSHIVLVLIDSGADSNFIDSGLVAQLDLLQVPHQTGMPLIQITHVTFPVNLVLSGGHQEELVLYILDTPQAPLVLRHPWLSKHNLWIDWVGNKVLGWSPFCLSHCLNDIQVPISPVAVVLDEFKDLSAVPPEFLDLRGVFSTSRTTALPPHCPYNCSIDLLPGNCIPRGHLFSLSCPEMEAMNKYIQESLATGIIRPSSSPAGAGFFFVAKKDGSTCPCIDDLGLNNITVKDRYPLPPMATAFESLQRASIFTKLDLRNIYHLVCIREGNKWKMGFQMDQHKVEAVKEWSQSASQ